MPGQQHNKARLQARPGTADRPARPPGTYQLGSGRDRDGLLIVPPGFDAGAPAPLLVLLHGAGGDAARLLPLFEAAIARCRALVLVPESAGPSWDVIHGGWGPDVAALDEALGRVFAEFAVDPGRVAVGGFSDGASYALSLGLANGDLFGTVLAFSPGFAAPPLQAGRPRIFMCHGTADTVLPIARCSRPLHARLEKAGYDVLYREFAGGHAVPPALAAEGVRWWLGMPAPGSLPG